MFGGQSRRSGPKPDFTDVERVQDWLAGEFAKRLGLTADDIDVNTPLSSYGLDSRRAIALAGDLEKLMGRELAPTLAWDYPTVTALAQYLVREATAAQ